jgi:hypothetical protein
MMDLFRKKKKEPIPKPIKIGVFYFVDGEDVVFDFNGLDFTFEKFYLMVNDEGMYLIVKDEAPLNLINLLETVVDEVGVRRKDVLDSDNVDFILKLDDALFKEVKDEILKQTEAKEIFEIQYKGHELLKVLTAYSIEEYSTFQSNFNVYAKGPLVDAIKRKLR